MCDTNGVVVVEATFPDRYATQLGEIYGYHGDYEYIENLDDLPPLVAELILEELRGHFAV